MSDLHLEFFSDYGRKFLSALPADGDEVLVLAGDVFNFRARSQHNTLDAMEILATKYRHIVYVPGNHEYWESSPDEATRFISRLQREFEPLRVLTRNKVVLVEDHRFLGDTMWFPFNPSNWAYERNMPDFRMIEGLQSFAYRENSQFREFLRVHCRPGDIVVTHHLPTYRSVPDRFENSQVNRFFVSDMSPVINKNRPGLWIHGHTHEAFDYVLSDTRIVCNPRGYPGEMSTMDWRPDKIIEVK